MSDAPLRLLILGAHPDDSEFHAGGLASLYRELGHEVRMVSATDGSAGHHLLGREELARVRKKEAASSAAVIGAVGETWEFPDGELQATLDLRHRVIAEIRRFRPDLVLTHRTNDYHPDHRAVGQAVQDASFLVRVPLVVPEVPALDRDPVVAYMADMFTKPSPLDPHVVLDIGSRIDTIVRMLAQHASQVFEWLPFLDGTTADVPAGEAERLAWLKEWYTGIIRPRADRCREALRRIYSIDRTDTIELVEMFEISEHGGTLTDSLKAKLFPWMT
ncbi:MAG: PIG-L family deacetylase [Planctomycetaceae bacterium]|nr:PIG-L family deacetylase [Planctomycetaceae bacterium]